MKKFFFVLFFITHCAQPNDLLEISEASIFSVAQSVTSISAVGLGFATSELLCRNLDVKKGALCGLGLYGLLILNRKIVDKKRAAIKEVSEGNRHVAKLIADAFFAVGLVTLPYCLMELVRSKGVNIRLGLGA